MWDDHGGGLRSLCFRQAERSMLRCVEVDLGGRTMVVGPIPQASPEALAATAPAWLVAPNQYHNLGLKKWSAKHGSTMHAASSALGRVRKVAKVDATALTAIPLPGHVSFLTPPGTKNGEVWVRVAGKDGVTWIVGDAFFNVTPTTPNTFEGWFLSLSLGGPGLRIGQSFLWVALDDPRAYAYWVLDQLVADKPVRLIPSHGEVIEGPELWSQLAALVRARVGV